VHRAALTVHLVMAPPIRAAHRALAGRREEGGGGGKDQATR